MHHRRARFHRTGQPHPRTAHRAPGRVRHRTRRQAKPGVGPVAGYRLRRETRAQAWLILVGVAVTLVVLAFFAVDTVRNAPQTFTAIVVVAALAVVLDLVWKRARGDSPADDAASAPTAQG